MQEWAVELQRFFTSGASDRQTIARAANACDDPEISPYLRTLPPRDEQSAEFGRRFVQQLARQGFSSEATILQLFVCWPAIVMAENGRKLPIKDRSQFAVFLKGLTDTCRAHPEMAPSLAMMCGLTGTYHRATQDFAAARDAYEEARDIRRKLADADPQTYESGLVRTLNNLGNLYRATRDFAAARGAYEEARDIQRRLAGADLQAHENDLAGTLNNLGNLYRDTRDFAAARGAYEEARDIRRRLAGAGPQAYGNDLAGTLNNLGIIYRATRDFAAARGAYEEARDIRRKLADADPQTYESDLAATLNNLGVLYSTTRDFAAARDAYEKAHDTYAKLASADPQTYESDLAGTLNNLGNLYRDTRDFAAARGAYEKARTIYAKLAGANPQTYESEFATTLNNLGTLYSITRDFAAARGAYEEACGIYAKLAGADPQTYGSSLAGTFNNLGNLYRDTQDFAAARGAHKEAVTLAESITTVSGTPLHLSKGLVSASYRFLLSEASNDKTRAFALLAAQRDGRARSAAVTAADLAATQSTLAEMGRSGPRPCALLAPTTGVDKNTMTLGLVTAENCQWFPQVAIKGWDTLFSIGSAGWDQREFRQLARDIWRGLPEPIQAIMSPDSSQTHDVVISGDRLWSAFPWELLRFGDGESDYLGLHTALPRCGSVLVPALEAQFAAKSLGSGHGRIAIVAPHTTGRRPLSGVEREIGALERLVPAAGGTFVTKETGDAAHDHLMIEAIRNEPSILYFSGHGIIVNAEELLVLHRSPRPKDPRLNISYFGADSLDRMASERPYGPLFPHAPLVVMNSCLTGGTRNYGGFREDLVHAFLHHGAGAVIATALPILDDVGEALGRALFDPLALAQPTIGSLVVESRRQLACGACADIDDVRWGAWGMVHIHGNANATPPLRTNSETLRGKYAAR